PLLDPLLVAKLATMELRARYVVEGALSGRHRSARQGHSLEFAGHRAYTPSDEWRHIDWKVFAKTDRWVVREQQEETNLHAALFLDTSNSMAFASEGRLSKIHYASILLAALGYLLVHRRESVGLGFFNDRLKEYVPPRGGAPHLAQLMERLEQVLPSGKTDIQASLEEAGQRLPRRSLVMIVSDFLFPPEAIHSSFRALLSRKHEVLALQVLDPAEIEFPFQGEFAFHDLETGETLQARADEVRDQYQKLLSERLEKNRRVFSSLGVDSHLFETGKPIDAELSVFLGRRAQSV
ncbi:MAG: DUF58 domain-containing protein, partial [Elusimicrobia bacterium]|nr:DUF58 domain-containing protein [Elusimicrobiota bacterium]